MPRMLVNGQWFDPVSARSIYENDYEHAILANATALFPGFHCVKFKLRVDSEYGSAKPDLALVDIEYRKWVVVEVELDIHSLRSHVEDQVRRLAYGVYNSRHADYISERAPKLDKSKMRQMLLGIEPEVLVLVTSNQPEWTKSLAQFGARVGVIEMFRGDLDDVILRVNGDQPRSLEDQHLSVCHVDGVVPNLLRLHSPGPFANATRINLMIDGAQSIWKIIRTSDTAYLLPDGRSPIDGQRNDRYKIVRNEIGELELRQGG